MRIAVVGRGFGFGSSCRLRLRGGVSERWEMRWGVGVGSWMLASS